MKRGSEVSSSCGWGPEGQLCDTACSSWRDAAPPAYASNKRPRIFEAIPMHVRTCFAGVLVCAC